MLHATSLKSPRHRVHRNGRLRQRVWLSSSGLAPRLSSPVHAVLRQIRRAKHLQRCICAEGFWVDNRLTPPVMAVMDRPTLPQTPATALLLLLLLVFAAMLAYPSLPSLEVLTDYQPKIPLRIYSAEGVLLGEFGEERRELVKINEVPDLMKKAILAAEDDRVYEHGGVDWLGMLRAASYDFTSGDAKQGASTITMQVARNFFLSNEKTLTRKFKEVLLALKIEHKLSKDEIFQLYINQIYLGQHSYGFAAASQTYFGKNLNQITVAEMAMLAGLPKAPSAYNPMVLSL